MNAKTFYNKTVTILNKLNRKDSATGLDVWYKTTVTNAAFYFSRVANVSGQTVSMGQTFTVLLPFSDKYRRYADWKQPGKQVGHYTVSEGDYIVLSSISDDVITPDNVEKIRQKYEPYVCQVRAITENEKRGGAMVQLKIEGV